MGPARDDGGGETACAAQMAVSVGRRLWGGPLTSAAAACDDRGVEVGGSDERRRGGPQVGRAVGLRAHEECLRRGGPRASVWGRSGGGCGWARRAALLGCLLYFGTALLVPRWRAQVLASGRERNTAKVERVESRKDDGARELEVGRVGVRVVPGMRVR